MRKKTVVLVHGRHVQTKGWETLVWGDGELIGTAPLGLSLALKHDATLILGTGASEKDGVKECELTYNLIKNNFERLGDFPEFHHYWKWNYKFHEMEYEQSDREKLFSKILEEVHLDSESVDTVTEIKNAIEFAKSVRATELIQVTSPFHAARCMSISAKLLEDGFDFGQIIPMVVSSRSSTQDCRAGTTVIMEHPHRGDDAMINSSIMPHQVFPRMFKLPPSKRIELFEEVAALLAKQGV